VRTFSPTVQVQVEKRLNGLFSGWSVVHVDPVNRDHPLYAEVQAYLDETLPAIPGVEEFHDLRIVGSDETPFVIFDLKVESDDADCSELRPVDPVSEVSEVSAHAVPEAIAAPIPNATASAPTRPMCVAACLAELID
jgi:hypothetical protein